MYTAKRPDAYLSNISNQSNTALSTIRKKTNKHVPGPHRHVDHLRISEMSELTVTFDIGEEIGKGSFGVVLQVKDKFNEKVWAMKVVEKHSKKGSNSIINREIEILRLVSHPHIIYLDKVYECPRKIYLVMELCIGELSKLVQTKKTIEEREARKFIRDTIAAVAYLHKNDIVHRDLKLENILLAQNPHDPQDKHYIKISDFGLSIIKIGHGLDHMLSDFCGTLTYMSPEIVLKRSYSQQCDVWAVGVIMYIMLTGVFPFYAEKSRELESIICSSEPDYDAAMLSKEARNLLTRMLEKNPAVRITAAEAQYHPWLAGQVIKQSTPENVLDMMKQWKAELASEVIEFDDLYNLPAVMKDIQTAECMEGLLPSTSAVSLPATTKSSRTSTKKLGANYWRRRSSKE